MCKSVKLVFLFIKMSIISRLKYKSDVITFIIGVILENMSIIIFILFLYYQKLSISTYSKQELLFIIGLSKISFGLFYTFLSNLFNLGYSYVIRGEIEKFLIRPFSVFIQICLEKVNTSRLIDVTIGLLLVTGNYKYSFGDISISRIVLLILLMFSSTIIISSFYVIAISLSFFIKNFNFINIIFGLETISNYPLSLYGKPFKFIFSFIIPFLFAGSIPYYILTNISLTSIVITFISLIIFLFFAAFVWKFSLAHYDSVGN